MGCSVVRMSEQQIHVGASVLGRHVGRLAKAAGLLVDTDPGLAFSLWSIGVEEAAKLSGLREAAANKSVEVPSWVAGQNGDVPKGLSVHQHKFETGLHAIGVPQGSLISKSVKITSNSSERVQSIRNTQPGGSPLNTTVSIGPFTTGEFEDGVNTDVGVGILSASPVSHALRFENLYVDFDSDNGWRNPIIDIAGQGLVGRVSLSKSRMDVLIDSLASYALG